MSRRAFKDPLKQVNDNYIILDNIIKQMHLATTNRIVKEKEKAIKLISKVDALSPLKTLTRGYCITTKGKEVLKSINELKVDDEIDIRFIDGFSRAKILEKGEK